MHVTGNRLVLPGDFAAGTVIVSKGQEGLTHYSYLQRRKAESLAGTPCLCFKASRWLLGGAVEGEGIDPLLYLH